MYTNALGLRTNSAAELDSVIAAYGVHLFDRNQKRGSLQRFRYALFDTMFLRPDLKQFLSKAHQAEKG